MKKRTLSTLIRILITLALIFLVFYFTLPAINLRSKGFWSFLVVCILIVLVINFFSRLGSLVQELSGYFAARGSGVKVSINWSGLKAAKYGLIAIAAIIVFSLVGELIGIQVFNATRYRDLITVTEGDFSQDVAELSMSQIPVVDKDTASRLGSRKLGEMSDLVSQFVILENYTQINYNGTPFRTTPLAYGDVIKWLYNHSEGLPAYINVDMVTQETSLVWLEDGMKYSTSEYFFHNIYRYVRFHYPTKIFETVSFEVDEEGVPYWVVPTITYRIALWSGKDIDGAVLVNAITGESQWYAKEDVPQWIDQLYTSELIMAQLDYNGLYQNGFINSIFGQKNVRQTTTGYNYIAIGDDVYLYTGMTSVTSDESNIGFVLVNLRTKETKYYAVPGATEESAQESAEGQVQHLKYVATFPLLLNVSDRPTYFVSLKDDAGLVKMYAFVDVEQYQVVGTGATVSEARSNYTLALNKEDIEVKTDPSLLMEEAGTISAIADVVVSGETYYYFQLQGSDQVYAAAVSVNEHLPFLQPGDRIAFVAAGDGEGLRTVSELTVK